MRIRFWICLISFFWENLPTLNPGGRPCRSCGKQGRSWSGHTILSTMPFDCQGTGLWRFLCLWNRVSGANSAIRLIILLLTPSHKKEEEVVKRAYEVMGILRSGLSETSKILGPTPKTHCPYPQPYHYQILIKYRLEDELDQPSTRFWPWLKNGK